MKESTEVVILDYEKMPAYAGAKEKQENLVNDNPFIEISDPKSYQLAKKYRTALKTGRTELQNGEKTIASKLKEFRDTVKDKTLELIGITQNAEEKQQSEITRYENQKRDEALAAEKAEQERLEKLRDELNTLIEVKVTAIDVATINTIDGVISDIEALDSDFEDLQNDFLLKKSDLLSDARKKGQQLADEERLRIEKQEAAKETERLRKERVAFEKQKEADQEKRKKEDLLKKQNDASELALKWLAVSDRDINTISNSSQVRDSENYLESIIDEDFGAQDDKIKSLYEKLKEKLSKKKSELLEKERIAEEERTEEENNRKKLGVRRQEQLNSLGVAKSIDECLEFTEAAYFEFFKEQSDLFKEKQENERIEKEKADELEKENKRLSDLYHSRKAELMPYWDYLKEDHKSADFSGLPEESFNIILREVKQTTEQVKNEQEAKDANQKELQKCDFEKVSDLINDLSVIKEKYQFESVICKEMFEKVSTAIDETIHFIEKTEEV